MAAPDSGGKVLRLVGFIDFVIAIAIIATPVLRSRIGDTPAYAFAGFLLLGSAASYYMARRMDAMVASRPASGQR